MRLLQVDENGEFSLTDDLIDSIPPYATLSHTWGEDHDEVNFKDLTKGPRKTKPGYKKLRFCAGQAARDGLKHFWVDTCCIDKSNNTELSEAINSMFRWYCNAAKCYVYLSDVSTHDYDHIDPSLQSWEQAFQRSRWFTRGWTLQELIAPLCVEFFCSKGKRLGDKRCLEPQLHEITGIAVQALRGTPLSEFNVEERMSWAKTRQTKREEDKAYSLLGIFNIHMPLIYGEGAMNAFRRLREEIDKSSRPVKAHSPLDRLPPWCVPRPANTLFTGRVKILEEIKDALSRKSSQQRRFVITGVGGQGKSEMCLKVADSMREAFLGGVFWVDVSIESMANAGFHAVSEELGSCFESIDKARRLLSNTKSDWLLILDNADDPDFDYHTYLPPGNYGAIIMTSRNERCVNYHTVGSTQLGPLDEDDCVTLLLKAANVSSESRPQFDAAARKIVRNLESHTLALIQAGAYIAQNFCDIHCYPSEYREYPIRLLQFNSKQERSRRENVYCTFAASAEWLETRQTDEASDALDLLNVLSMLHYADVPAKLFEDAWIGCREVQKSNEMALVEALSLQHVSQLPGFIQQQPGRWDPFRLQRAQSLLKSLALIHTKGENSQATLSMHPLAHECVKEHQYSKRSCSWEMTGSILALSYYGQRTWKPYYNQVKPHLQSFLQPFFMKDIAENLSSQRMFVIQMLFQCGWLLHHSRDDSGLDCLLNRVFRDLGVDPNSPTNELLPLYDLYCRNLTYLGEQQAVKVLQKVVAIREETLPVTRLDLLASQHELAGAYMANRQIPKAVKLLQKVVNVQRRLPEDHPNRLASQHELAYAYLEDEQIQKAVQLLERIVNIQQTMPQIHPDRLASEHELGRAYRKVGQIQEAVRLLQKVVDVQRRLPEDHPNRLASERELARANRQLVVRKKVPRGHVGQIRRRSLSEDAMIPGPDAPLPPSLLMPQSELKLPVPRTRARSSSDTKKDGPEDMKGPSSACRSDSETLRSSVPRPSRVARPTLTLSSGGFPLASREAKGPIVRICDSRFKFMDDSQFPKPREFTKRPKKYRAGRGSSVPLDLSAFKSAVEILDNAGKEQQFQDKLEEIISTNYHTHEIMNNTLQMYLAFTTRFKGKYLQSEYDIARCLYRLQQSLLFKAHKEYLRRQIIYGLLQEGDTPSLYIIAVFLLLDGCSNEELFQMMRAEGLFPRPVELIQSQVVQNDPRLRRLLLELLYEMSRIQRLTWEDLLSVDDTFIFYLFQIIERISNDVNDPYHSSIIRALLVLNEQYMVASIIPTSTSHPPIPLVNRVTNALSTHGTVYKTFGWTLILLLSHETQISLQLLILKLLYLLFQSPSTAEYFYTNDLYILLDIILRNLPSLYADSRPVTGLRHTYLRVLHPLLANSQIKRPPHYKRDEILKILQLLLESGLHFAPADGTTVRLVQRCMSVPWLLS